MQLRNPLVLSIVAALWSGLPASSQVNGTAVADGATAQVFGGKSPSVQVTDAEGQVLSSIPIKKNPGKFIYSKSANTLYVVHDEKGSEHFISAVNLTTQKVGTEIKVGAGQWVDLLVSGDGRRLFCYTASKSPGLPSFGSVFVDERFLTPPFEPSIRVIDTASNEVTATYNWLGGFLPGFRGNHKTVAFSSQFIAASEKGVLVTESIAFYRKPIGQRLVVFSGQSPNPALTIDTGGRVMASMLCRDEKLLFAVIAGDKKTGGSLAVVDLEKGTVVKHDLNDQPTRLFRLGSKQEPWILGSEEMRSLSETGEPGDRRIPFSMRRKPEEGAEGGASAFLDGYPGETITLGDDHAAILINHKNGGSQHKVALLDLKKLQIDSIIPTMSGGEKARIRTTRILEAVALTAATGGSLVFTPNLGFRNESLAARPDGRFLFALDLESHEVTVVNVLTSTVVRRIPVNKSITKLQVSSDGKHLICFGKKTQQIDLESNELES